MGLKLTFRHMKPRDEIQRRAEALHAKLERFLDPASESTLTVGVEHGEAQLELVVLARGETHKVSEADDDLRTAMDRTFHTMEIQLRRAKERRLAHRHDVEEVDGFDEVPLS